MTKQGSFEPFGKDYSNAQDAGVFLRFPGQWDDESWSDSSTESGYYNVNRWLSSAIGRYSRPDPDPLVDPNSQMAFAYAGQSPLILLDSLGLRITWVDIPIQRHFNCAIGSDPEFKKAFDWLVMLDEDWMVRELTSSSSQDAKNRRRVFRREPGRGSFVDEGKKDILVDTADPSCKNIVKDLVREITEFYANRVLGKSKDTGFAFGGASKYADPIVQRAADKACAQCDCSSPIKRDQ